MGDCRSALVTALGLIEQTQNHNTDLVNGVKALIKGFDKTLGSFLKFLMQNAGCIEIHCQNSRVQQKSCLYTIQKLPQGTHT